MEGRHHILESTLRICHICWKVDTEWRDQAMQHVQMICEYSYFVIELVVAIINNYFYVQIKFDEAVLEKKV